MLWEKLLGKPLVLEIMEDNQGTEGAIEKGYSPALRHLPKTQKCCLDFLHEVITVQQICHLTLVPTNERVADIFTKAVAVYGWPHALKIMGIALRA